MSEMSERCISITELAGTQLATGLSPEQLEVLAQNAMICVFKDGENIVESADATHSLYLLISGRGQVKGSFDQDVNLIESGSLIGEMSFLDGKPRSASVISVGESSCAVFSHEMIAKIRAERPDIMVQMMWNLSLVLCEKLRRTSRLIDALSITGV